MIKKQNQPVRISVEEAKSHSDERNVTFLDVVDPGAYEKTDHQIEGAVRIDPREIKDEYARLSKDDEILAYCT
jgi:rhodanese-related sulfurtransferase